MRTLFQRLVEWREEQAVQCAASSARGHAREGIDELTNYDFLVEISDALEEMFDELQTEKNA